jgi:hypothetical protein
MFTEVQLKVNANHTQNDLQKAYNDTKAMFTYPEF